MFEGLNSASDDVLLSILAEADALDEIILERRLPLAQLGKLTRNGSLEVIILGSLGCCLGMLNGEAGGFLVRIAGVHLLVDPGPATVSLLSQLQMQERFRFTDLDAILCSHQHPDHITDLLPCIEGMTGGMRVRRGCVIGNRTVVEKFTAFSPYHLAQVRPIVLAPDASREDKTTQRHDKLLPSNVNLDGIHVWATPTFHLEEDDKWDTGIGFFIQSQAANIWYTSDTNLFDGLLRHVETLAGEGLTLVIANADASDMKHRPSKSRARHLLTRDVLEIARGIKPRYIMIQHYDEAYSSPRYRIAQALYLQRLVNRSGLDTVILPSANGLRLSFDRGRLKEHELYFEGEDGIVVKEYVGECLRGQYAR